MLVYRDGSVQVNHGGTEMGQGLYTKIGQIAVDALGVKPEAIRLMPARTDKIPNTSATAASSGTDLNGAAVLDACRKIRDTLRTGGGRTAASAILRKCAFKMGTIFAEGRPERVLTFAAVVEAAYRQRLPLFASGFYRTPEIHYDPKTCQGRPFYYFAYGAAVSEVEVDAFTGQYRVLRADLLEDVGESLSPMVDRGQIEGGFIQGVGWLTLEELVWDAEGRLATNGASTYKLPSWSEMPPEFHVDFLTRAAEPGVVFGSKAVGEPPLDAGTLGARGDPRRGGVVRSGDRRDGFPVHAGAGLLRDSAGTRRIGNYRASGGGSDRFVSQHNGPEIIRSTILHTPRSPFREPDALECFTDGALLLADGVIQAVGPMRAVHTAHPLVPVHDLRGGVVLPGFIDTHVHFPQLRIIGGLGCGLLDWLNRYALPEEVRMGEADYAACRRGRVCECAGEPRNHHGAGLRLAFPRRHGDVVRGRAREGDTHCQRAGAIGPPAAGAAAPHRRRRPTSRAGR